MPAPSLPPTQPQGTHYTYTRLSLFLLNILFSSSLHCLALPINLTAHQIEIKSRKIGKKWEEEYVMSKYHK